MASNLHNLPASQIVDDYGAVCAQIRGLELRRDAIKAALIEHARDATEVFGSQFRVGISTATRWTLDQAAVRAQLGEHWCTRHSKLAHVTSLRALPIAAPALPIAA